MHILIPIRRVPDTSIKIQVKDGEIDPTNLNTWVINPYDEYAIEEALRLIEEQGDGTITLIGIGSEDIQETLRKGLAMGADEAYHIQNDDLGELDPLGYAKVFAATIEKIGEYDFIWTGVKRVDEDHAQVGIMLADLLGLPHVSYVLTVKDVEDERLIVRAEAEGGYRTVKVPMPALLTETQGPNEPRYASLRGIMGAKRKPMTVWTAEDLAVDVDDLAGRLELLRVEKPPTRTEGRIIEGEPDEAARELVRLLSEDAKVL